MKKEICGSCKKPLSICKCKGKGGAKGDFGKPRWSLLPWVETSEIVDILTFGAAKYNDDNWKNVKNMDDRYFSAMQRHMVAWQNGERFDKESGKSHLAHAGCCLLFLMWGDNNPKKKK